MNDIDSSIPERSELREDVVQDRFVLVAPKRGARPKDVVPELDPESDPSDDPFSKEETFETVLHEDLGADGGVVRAIPNKFPAVSKDNPSAYGTQEVVVETPEFGIELAEFSVEQTCAVLRTYAARLRAISEDAKIRYILVFKNKGGKAGASLRHAHSQIFASEFVPPHIVRKAERLREFRRENGVDYYEHLFEQEEGGPRHIWSDERMLTFAPYASLYPYEAWIVPRRRVDNISLLSEEELGSLAAALHHVIQTLHAQNMPYNFYMHQTIEDDVEHFCLRVAPRVNTWAGVELGSRLIINTVSPEEAALFYRSL